jgi:hypothetical protein
MSDLDINGATNPAVPPEDFPEKTTAPVKTQDEDADVIPVEEPQEVEIVTSITSFEMSDNIADLNFGMCKVQAACSNGKKDTQGYGYEYMSLDQLTDIIRPNILDAGIAVYQWNETIMGTRPAVKCYTQISHASGQWLRVCLEIPITVMKQLTAAQMIGVAITYGRRYQMQALFMIAAETDTDGTIKN